MFDFNYVYLLLIIPGLLSWYAQAKVRRVYDRYRAAPNRRGISGESAAMELLRYHNLGNIKVEQVKGTLRDHYDPRTKTLRLSEAVIHSSSVTSLGIVAHEVGHALQDAEGYRFMRLRTSMARVLEALAWFSPLVFIGGMMYGNSTLMTLGGVMLASQAVFSLVTLPVERNASTRALESLQAAGLVVSEEGEGVKKVLRSAAFTYLVNLGKQLTTFLFFILVFGTTRGL
jgi:Zn-dependent membrane protease YugP